MFDLLCIGWAISILRFETEDLDGRIKALCTLPFLQTILQAADVIMLNAYAGSIAVSVPDPAPVLICERVAGAGLLK